MKQLKKWAALLLAFALMITLIPWTANAEFTEPTGSIVIKGVEEGATVKAYRLTKAVFENESFKEYINTAVANFANPQKPTDEEWKALVKKPVNDLGDSIDLTWNGTDGYTVSNQQAGLYMVLVTSNAGYVYNPILVGLSYGAEDNPTGVNDGKIELPEKSGGSFQIPDQAVLYMKKSEVTLTKKTSDPSEEPQSTVNGAAGQSDKGNGLGLNEKPNFTIETTIPSYATTDKNLVFTITDILDEGLTPPKAEEITVKVGGTAITPGADTATVDVDGQKITINFAESYLKGLSAESVDKRKVEITYSATLNDKATVNFKANENNVSLTYTNDPKSEDGKKTITDKTYHYTFDIDGLLNGQGSETSHELTKHGKIDGETKWYTKDSGLAGAEFTLYSGDPTGKKVVEGKKLDELQADEVLKYQTVTTTNDGRMNFQKLDEGVYYIKETKAPNGYSLNTNVYKVEIKADYNTNGTLKSYSITINDQATTTFKAQNEEQAPDTTNNPGAKQDGVVTDKDSPTLIENTKIPGLPSTGGMGTYLFTGLGVALLAGAAVMVTVLRKKNGQTTR